MKVKEKYCENQGNLIRVKKILQVWLYWFGDDFLFKLKNWNFEPLFPYKPYSVTNKRKYVNK